MSNNGRPAILGGEKLFAEGLSFTKPTTPPWSEVSGELQAMYESGWLTKGPHLRSFEEKMEKKLGVKHVVGVSSCTSGLILGLQSLGLKSGGEIVVPSFSFMATFHSMWWNNLKPVFVDCEPDTFTADVSKMEAAVTDKTAALCAVSVFGNPVDFEAIEELGRRHGLPVFYDSAHGMGTLYHGRPLGGHGSFEVFSLSPTKLLTGGEGGLVATNSDEVAAHVVAGRDYGNPGTYECPHVGLNARMAEANAIIASAGADHLEEYAEGRNKAAQAYKAGLEGIPGLTFQTIRENSRSSYKDFAILVGKEFGVNRDLTMKALNAEGIPSRAYFNPAGHRLSCYGAQDLDLPVTASICSRVICPPICSDMNLDDVAKVCEAFRRIYNFRSELA